MTFPFSYRFGQLGPCIDTEQDVMWLPVILFNIVGIIGGDHLQLILPGKSQQDLIDIFLAVPGRHHDAPFIPDGDVLEAPMTLQFDLEVLAQQFDPPSQ